MLFKNELIKALNLIAEFLGYKPEVTLKRIR